MPGITPIGRIAHETNLKKPKPGKEQCVRYQVCDKLCREVPVHDACPVCGLSVA
jgi:hypothetical protein